MHGGQIELPWRCMSVTADLILVLSCLRCFGSELNNYIRTTWGNHNICFISWHIETYHKISYKVCIFTEYRAVIISNIQWYPFHPRVTAVAHDRSRSFCAKCSWQVTNKHAYSLRMWLCMKWSGMVHGCMVYTERRTQTDVICNIPLTDIHSDWCDL